MYMYQQRPRLWWKQWRMEDERKKKNRTLVECGFVMLIIGVAGCVAGLTTYFAARGRVQTGPQEELPKGSIYTRPQRPNIIFITAKEIGWHDIKYNNPAVHVYTPNLDNIARNGRTLENHYVQSDSVSSHHAFLTGSLPYKSKMQHGPFHSAAPYCTGSDLTLISRSLKQRGYSTHALGRWSLGFCSDRCTPMNRGFDHFYGHYTDTTNGSFYEWKDGDQTSSDPDDIGKFYTELLSDRVLDTITSATRPFFIYLAFSDAHNHLQIPSQYTSLYPDCDKDKNSLTCLYMGDKEERERNLKRQKYLGMVSAIDEAVGRIQAAVDDKTIIIFTTDTGGSPQVYADNLPLRGATGTLYEGGTRTRAVISSALLQTSAQTSHHKGLFHATDWAATISALSGTNPSYQHDGVDQTDMILFGLPSKRDAIIYNIDMENNPLHGQSAIRDSSWKLIWGFDGVTNGRGFLESVSYRTDAGSLVVPRSSWQLEALPQTGQDKVKQLINERTWSLNNLSSGMIRLYNLTGDPYEYEDLSGDGRHSAVIQELKLRLIQEVKNNYMKPPESYSQPRTDLATLPEHGWC